MDQLRRSQGLVMSNTLDEVRQKIIKASFSPDYWGEDYSILSINKQEFIDKIANLITEARVNELGNLADKSDACTFGDGNTLEAVPLKDIENCITKLKETL